MTSWLENNLTEPPLLKHVFSDSLHEFIRKTSETEPHRNVGLAIYFPQFPCHSQEVERAVN